MKEFNIQKNDNILALDFDDCLIPWAQDLYYSHENQKEFIFDKTYENFKLIKNYCEKLKNKNLKIFITSSWSKFIIKKNDKFEFLFDDQFHQDLWNKCIYPNIKDYLVGYDIYNNRSDAIFDLRLKTNGYIFIFDDRHFMYPEEDPKIYFYLTINGANLDKKLQEIERILQNEKKYS
jgi:hypothetical protein